MSEGVPTRGFCVCVCVCPVCMTDLLMLADGALVIVRGGGLMGGAV